MKLSILCAITLTALIRATGIAQRGSDGTDKPVPDAAR